MEVFFMNLDVKCSSSQLPDATLMLYLISYSKIKEDEGEVIALCS